MVAYFSLFFIPVLLIGYNHASALVATDASKKMQPDKESSQEISLSLWLLPPRTTHHKIKGQIHQLAENGKRGPTFEPHITIVGGIKCISEAHALELARRLETGLKGFGKVPCSLSPVPYAAKGVWNQALYFTVETSASLMNLCQKARAILGMDTENWTFPAPATYPHLSVFYGIDEIPEKMEVQAIMPFHAYTVALWRTDPATLEGVRQWREISVIDIQ